MVLDILVQPAAGQASREEMLPHAPQRMLRRPTGAHTDKLNHYGAAERELLPSVEHRQPRSLNNRAENSPQPIRQRERRRPGCKSARHTWRFLTAYEPIAQYFRLRRYCLSAPDHP
jgi:putative transposase